MMVDGRVTTDHNNKKVRQVLAITKVSIFVLVALLLLLLLLYDVDVLPSLFVTSFVVVVPPQHEKYTVQPRVITNSRNRRQQRARILPQQQQRTNPSDEEEKVVDTKTTSSSSSSSSSTTTTAKATSTITATSIEKNSFVIRTGIPEFEEWVRTYSSDNKFYINEYVSHTIFDNNGGLRGLRWNGKEVPNKNIKIAEIPLSATIRSKPTTSPELSWDTSLVLQLWKELQLGQQSKYWGYCQLLAPNYNSSSSETQQKLDTNTIAPHAIRHWTNEQKERLLHSVAGQKLLEFNNHQQQDWITKYRKLDDDDGIRISWDEFVWCMEVVHSRAFTGIGGAKQQQEQSTILLSIAAPIIAALFGFFVFSTNTSDNTSESSPLLIIGAIIATLPIIGSSFFTNNNQSGTSSSIIDASLLPFIDSANHNDTATDSKIEYNPLTAKYELSIGPNSVLSSTVMDNQIFVRYGTKSTIELLLNYGFVPSVQRNADDDDDTYRSRLADALNESSNQQKK